MGTSSSRAACGLSPLARGTLRMRNLSVADHRFIPAGAGNTFLENPQGDKAPVYPRWRGEHKGGRVYPQLDCGLSPLARGTRIKPLAGAFPPRFIPAGAGNTLPEPPAPVTVAVYPRWRGEHAAEAQRGTLEAGLSPLARGTLYQLATR